MIARWLSFLAGNMILAAGIVLTANNPWGPAPWETLHLSVAQRFGFSLGTVITGASVALLGVTLLLRGGWSIRIGTALNTALIGLFVDLYTAMGVPDAHSVARGLVYLGAGIIGLSLGAVLYTRAGFGAGARDGLALVLSQRLPFTVGRVRLAIDALAALFGWVLGGPLGISTLIIVAASGPTADLFLRLIGRGHLPSDVRIPEKPRSS